jgi:DMSO reductase family type II enzyme chaperone
MQSRCQLRSHAYGLLAALIDYPDDALLPLIANGQAMTQCRQVLSKLHPELEHGIAWPDLADTDGGDALAVEYTRLFDVAGSGGPLCPLHGGGYRPDSRMQLLQELVRFYNHFGLTTEAAPARELPDHLVTQLEFLHYLSHQETERLDHGEGADDCRRARRDFLDRHLAPWLPRLAQRLAQQQAMPYYRTLGDLLARFVRLETQMQEASACA